MGAIKLVVGCQLSVAGKEGENNARCRNFYNGGMRRRRPGPKYFRRLCDRLDRGGGNHNELGCESL